MSIYGIATVLFIIGLGELAKRLGLPEKFTGLFAVGCGLGIAYGYTYLAEEPAFQSAMVGLALGLSAVGLYSAGKNTRQGLTGE